MDDLLRIAHRMPEVADDAVEHGITTSCICRSAQDGASHAFITRGLLMSGDFKTAAPALLVALSHSVSSRRLGV
jgi:hypothetical protein